MNGARRDRASEGGPISVQTRFERFPAAVKGAFVMRGADGNPHAVRVDSARVQRFPSGAGTPFSVEERLLDANPIRDLFVPFEAPVLDLPPGWYVIESSIQVDGARTWTFSSRPFSVPWPRSDVRRGSVALGKAVRAGDQRFSLERVEMNPNWAAVIWKPIRPSGGSTDASSLASGGADEPDASGVLLADDRELEIIPETAVGVPQLRSA
ncbi:MAG TPA: hypothetical protein VF660_10755, partial [Actinomycetota bacterium]